MANKEACELYIEQEIDAALDKGKKPYTIGKELAIWIEKLFEVKINPKTIESRAYRKRTSDEVKPKPPKTHTKPEVKKQLGEVAREIENGNVTDDDIKVLDKATAKAITNGKAAPRVGTATATAIKKVRKKKGGITLKPIDNFKRLNNQMKAVIDGLTLFAEGTMKPQTESEAEYARAILAKAANFIIQYARLGADIEGILHTFVKGGINDSDQKHNQSRQTNR